MHTSAAGAFSNGRDIWRQITKFLRVSYSRRKMALNHKSLALICPGDDYANEQNIDKHGVAEKGGSKILNIPAVVYAVIYLRVSAVAWMP